MMIRNLFFACLVAFIAASTVAGPSIAADNPQDGADNPQDGAGNPQGGAGQNRGGTPPVDASEATIAGHTVAEYAEQLGAKNRVVRLRAAKSLGAFGAEAAEPLGKALTHEDAAVRYIAAVHLGRIGGQALKDAVPALETMLKQHEDSVADQMAAAYALCSAGQIDQHLPKLIETLEYPERGTACSAAELIGMLGPAASEAVKPLKAMYEQHRPGAKGGDYHRGGAAMNALRKIEGET